MKKTELKEIIREVVFEAMTEELCAAGKAYIRKRKAAGEKSSAYLSGRAVKVCKGQMQGENTLTEYINKELEKRNEPLFNKLVPGMGDAETVEGEILRAINRIAYRYYNDGDKYFEGYGTETAGPAHAFLVDANHPLKSAMNQIFDEPISDREYETMIDDALDMILDYIESRQGKYTKNTLGSIFDYEPHFEDEEDEEDDYDDYDDEDDDYFQESINEKEIEIDDNTEFNISLKHLLDKHIVKKDD